MPATATIVIEPVRTFLMVKHQEEMFAIADALAKRIMLGGLKPVGMATELSCTKCGRAGGVLVLNANSAKNSRSLHFHCVHCEQDIEP